MKISELIYYQCSKTGKAFNQMADENDWPIVEVTFRVHETRRMLGSKLSLVTGKPMIHVTEFPLVTFRCISEFAEHEVLKHFGFYVIEENPKFGRFVRNDTHVRKYCKRTSVEIAQGKERLKLSRGMGNPYLNSKLSKLVEAIPSYAEMMQQIEG